LTSPYKFYQFWVNAADADLPNYIRYFTLKSQAEVESMEKDLADNPNERKRLLAEELTTRVHSKEDFDNVMKVSELLYKKVKRDTLLSLNENTLALIANEIPSPQIAKEVLAQGTSITELLTTHTNILSSNSEVRKAIKNNAISVNKEKVSSHETSLNHEDLLHGRYLMIENGKRNKFMIVVNSNS